jgi:hypothetical protein
MNWSFNFEDDGLDIEPKNQNVQDEATQKSYNIVSTHAPEMGCHVISNWGL